MTDNAARFLGFAFASADMLFEIDPDGKVVFAMGATQRVLGIDQAQAVGCSWREFIADDDHDLIAALIEGLSAADRRGPVKIEMRPRNTRKIRRYAGFSACRLPQVAPNISCVLSLAQAMGGAQVSPGSGENRMHEHASFMAATRQLLDSAREAGLDLDLELVQLKGLEEAASLVDGEEAEAMMRRVTAAVRAESFFGHGAAKLGEDQFAVVRNRADAPDNLLNRLQKAAAAAGVEVDANSASLTLAPEAATLHTMRALRFALDSFLKSGPQKGKAAFQTVLENTVQEAHAFTALVKEKRFKLVFQPVVELESAELQYFETLVRLGEDSSPAKAIRLAEELELIVDLDLAVTERVIRKLNSEGNSRLRLSCNISARSLVQSAFMGQFLKMISAETGLSDRLIFEITESSAFDDLDLANTGIQRIRQHGYAVCLDDFGASGASISNLRSLSVDSVKIDGQYARDVAGSGRDSALVRHLTQLCDELGVLTIAEMVETAEAATVLGELGVRYGQGWRFGRPEPEPVYEKPTGARTRRVGESESWR